MRTWIGASLVLWALLMTPAGADTLRVGSRVLATGDTAARVIELLGPPVHRSPAVGKKAARSKGAKRRGKSGGRRAADPVDASGERWQYRRGGRTVTIVLVQGRVARIE